MTTALAIAETPTHTARAISWRRWLPLAFAAVVLVGLTIPGISYRRWAWDFTEPGRFEFDRVAIGDN